jgi:tetratricopeptide (TPR) repeat protein
MEYKSPWPLLRAGKGEQEQGLELCRQAYAQNPNASYTMQLGIALLWLKQYAQTWEHFRQAIERKAPKGTSNKSDAFYGMAGVAKWCLGERREAIAEWVLGLEAKRARSSGLGVKMPLLLFFASVLSPELYDAAASRKLMLEKTKDTRIQVWPGPILQWILGQNNGGEFLRCCQGRHQQDLQDNLWEAEFYKGLMRFDKHNPSLFKESMRALSDTKQLGWESDDLLLRRIWGEEFFLARHEANV